jgi:formylglycine-generating enzyme required for sulfatase activity
MSPRIILDAMDLVQVPAGWFWMGWERGHPAERPRHRVWLDRFAIGRAPVTNREYAAFLPAGGTEAPAWWQDPRFNDPDQPVVGVSWFDATQFCHWLADRHGGSYRLPTEAEWEKAARAGLEDARFPGARSGRRPRPSTGRLARPRRPPTRSAC